MAHWPVPPCRQHTAIQGVRVQQQHHHQQRRRSAVCRSAAASPAGGSSGAGGALSSAVAALAAFVQAQFLPVALVTGILVGCAYPAAGVAVGALPNLTALVTTAMFIISGLQLRQGEALQALKARGEQRLAGCCRHSLAFRKLQHISK